MLPEESYIDVVKRIVENRKYFEKEYTKHSWLSYEQALKAGTLEYQLQNLYVRRWGLSPLSACIKHIPCYIDKNGGMTYYDPYFFDPEKPDDTQS